MTLHPQQLASLVALRERQAELLRRASEAGPRCTLVRIRHQEIQGRLDAVIAGNPRASELRPDLLIGYLTHLLRRDEFEVA